MVTHAMGLPRHRPMRLAVSAGWCSIVVLVSSRDAPATYRRSIWGDIMDRSLRLLAVLALGVALATATTAAAVAAPPPPTTIEDHNDRLLRHLRAEQAARTQAAVELYRSMERNFVPAADFGGAVAVQPAARPVPAVPTPGVGVVASLLLGLVGGVVGGCAALAGWTAATRRRLRQPASAT
jgi:hypothetical protein